MPFAAFDLHKKEVEAVILSDLGELTHRERFPTTRAALLDFAKRKLTTDTQLALEATTNTWPVVELLRPFVHSITVSNPMKTRAIAEAKIKTDKIDALILAQLLRLNYLPAVWCPDPETQTLRRLSTERTMLVNDRTRVKNRIHSILHQRLITAPDTDLFSPESQRWLEQLEIDPEGRQCIDRQLRLLASIEAEIEPITKNMATHAWHNPRIKLLMTLPGVDFTVAESLLAALGDTTRFPSAKHAASYLGLTPSTYQSGNHSYHGRITKQGSSHARFMMVEAAQTASRHPGPLGHFFNKLKRKKGRNPAIVALAHKLVVIAWHMLKNNEPYRYAMPSTLNAKFSRLRIQVTGEKRKGGYAKGSKRPASYGSGLRSKGVPGLATLYEKEQLPPNPPLRMGERNMLAACGLADLPLQLQQHKRVPKK